jgi:mono/diheme cytochrome c family protein
MIKTIRFQIALTALTLFAGAVIFAQSSGQATYKAKCQNCHGATGMADTPVGKALKVKPVTDPSVKKFTEAQMVDATKNGMGKMQPFAGKLTDAQIKDSVDYFRTFVK